MRPLNKNDIETMTGEFGDGTIGTIDFLEVKDVVGAVEWLKKQIDNNLCLDRNCSEVSLEYVDEAFAPILQKKKYWAGGNAKKIKRGANNERKEFSKN